MYAKSFVEGLACSPCELNVGDTGHMSGQGISMSCSNAASDRPVAAGATSTSCELPRRTNLTAQDRQKYVSLSCLQQVRHARSSR